MGNETTPSQFSNRQLQRLYHRFKQFDDNNSGDFEINEIMQLNELNQNPIVKRVFSIFDKNKDGKVSFMEFITGLSCLYGGDEETKCRFMFQIYDLDDDGFISEQQLFDVLKMLVGGNVTEQQLQSLAKRTIYQANTDCEGRISYEQFKMMTKSFNIKEKLKINKI